MTSKEILRQLNKEQAAAAACHTGPVLVLAGAGTGKTRVITYRIASMLAEGIAPESILGLTFTNKAAREMRERLAQLVGEEASKRVTLGTFHSFCIRILRKHIARLGFQTGFTIADESDQQGIFKQALGECGCSYDGFPGGELVRPTLASLEYPCEQCARAAVWLILHNSGNGVPQHITLPMLIRPGESIRASIFSNLIRECKPTSDKRTKKTNRKTGRM
jgi:hypothetical protein